MNMIKKTQYKFIAITLSAISFVLVLILGLLNLGVYIAIVYNSKQNIQQIEDRRGFVFAPNIAGDISEMDPDNNFSSMMNASGKVSYMYVKIYSSNTSSPLITTNMSDTYSADDIYQIAEFLISRNNNSGMFRNMMYNVTKTDMYTTVVMVDISNDISMLHSMFNLSLIIIIASLIIVFVFTYFLSKWAIKPVKTAFENQRRFISDASHELKTPLTVISANADVLESEVGDNKWLSNIKSQSVLMTQLVYDLLDLAKLDETKDEMIMCEFDLSSTVLNKALEFECAAFENNKSFEQDIKEGIKFKGNEDSIKHLVTILIDNAIKHSDENGEIRVTLTTDGNKKIFQVYNTGNGIKNDEKSKIFDRFYRSDKSRSKETGGYGLGLSIAKSIVDANHGSISVDGEENKWVSFTVILQ